MTTEDAQRMNDTRNTVQHKLAAKRARKAARAFVEQRGMRTAAREIGISTDALARYLADMPVLRGTVAMIEAALKRAESGSGK